MSSHSTDAPDGAAARALGGSLEHEVHTVVDIDLDWLDKLRVCVFGRITVRVTTLLQNNPGPTAGGYSAVIIRPIFQRRAGKVESMTSPNDEAPK